MTQLRFLHANVRSWHSNGHELFTLIGETGAAVVSLNETWLKPRDTLDTPGFQCFRFDRPDRIGGGVALLVRDDIPATPLDLGQSQLGNEVVACRLHLGQAVIAAASIYCPPGCPADRGLFSQLAVFDQAIILGDFNAKSPTLGSRGANNSGPILVDIVSDLNLCVLNNGEPTHTATNGMSDQLDLILATPRLAARAGGVTVGPDFGSDHLPVIVDVTCNGHRQLPQLVELRYDFKCADWDGFRESLREQLGDAEDAAIPQSPLDIDRLCERITTAISRAAEHSIPRRPPRLLKTWRMSKELLRLIRARRRVRRLWMETRLPCFKVAYNRLSQRRNALIAQAKSDSWFAFCERLQRLYHVSSHEFWHRFKNLESGSQGQGSKRTPPLLRPDGTLEVDNEAKAALFSQRLASAFKTRSDADMDAGWKKEVEDFVSLHDAAFRPLPNMPAGPTSEFTDVTPEDVQGFAEKLPMKAPGPDGILNPFLRNGGSRLFGWLALLFTASLSLGYYPRVWKLAKIIMIRKPGKNPHIVKDYRPISLLAAIARLLEKLQARRFLRRLERMGLLPLHQSSCRSARQTYDHLFRLTQEVKVGFACNQDTVAGFLDVEGAFDSVWHDGLRYKLAKSGLPACFVRWISDLLRNRRFFVQHGQSTSSIQAAEAGVPQGSPLSPLLYIFYTADMPSDPALRVMVSTFADDIALWARNVRAWLAAARVQMSLDAIVMWCRRWRLKLKPEKCNVVCFSRRRQVPEIRVRLCGQNLSQLNSAKFLGVTFDRKLNFGEHIRGTRDAATKKLNALRALAGRNRGLDPVTLVAVYLAFVRSFIEYGCCAWIGASHAQVDMLQKVQNTALRIALRKPSWTRITDLHDMAGIQPLADVLSDRTADFLNKALAVNPLVGETIGLYRGMSALYPGTPLAFIEERLLPGPWHRIDLVRQRLEPPTNGNDDRAQP